MTEPIAFFDPQEKGFYWAKPTKVTAPTIVDVEPLALYTHRTWVGLTDEEWNAIYYKFAEHGASVSGWDFAIAIEAKLKEKNT
jgi:hypothetical protein